MRYLRNTMARPVGGVSFGPKDLTLVAGGSGGFDIWDLANSTHTFVPSHAVKNLYGCVYDPLGRWVYVSDYRGGFRLLPVLGHEALPAPGSPHERHVISFGLTPDGKQLVMSRGGGRSNRLECWNVLEGPRKGGETFVPVWSIRDGKPIDPNEPYLHNQATWFTNGVAIGRDGKSVAAAESRAGGVGIEPFVVLRHGTSGKVIADIGKSATSFDTRLAMAPDGQTMYAWDNRLLERWDVKAGRRTHNVPAPGRGHFQGLAVHPTGRVVITVSSDGQARYWDPPSLSLIRAIKCAAGKLHSLALDRDGTMAAAGGDKGQVVLWDVEV
ncbi:MAG: WD40 repeat domain-containing protein [Gemmataceae bacterium]|nr:WD40 repeat domain-containing protein [Gemmataceae bacterium]